MEKKYGALLVWSDEDAGYVATSPEFPGLSGVSSDPEEALRDLWEALGMAIEEYSEQGRELPEPNRLAEHSGQIRLRMPKSLHTALAQRAEWEGVSLNTLAVSLLAEGSGRATGQSAALQSSAPLWAELASFFQREFTYKRMATSSTTQSIPPEGWRLVGRSVSTVQN